MYDIENYFFFSMLRMTKRRIVVKKIEADMTYKSLAKINLCDGRILSLSEL